MTSEAPSLLQEPKASTIPFKKDNKITDLQEGWENFLQTVER